MMKDRRLSIDEIAAYLGMKRYMVYKLFADNQMPVHRLGRLWKFRKEEVNKWITSGSATEPDSRDSAGG